ncbi:MAG TPA: acyl-CoA dehydrogenase family protein, partial [Chloroflexota bacterium]|nr:acyl-CoA dehydrogenase family protein [Chloroflexota bacterium]
MISFELTDEQKILVQTVRDFAARELAPVIQENDIEQRYDPATFGKLAGLGLTGICFPTRYGGAGMDYISLALVCEELECVDTSLRVIISVHVGLCSGGIYQWGNDEQKEQYLIPLARGERFGAFGLTGPEAGSDVAGMNATARRDGNDYILNGEKIWVSAADVADTFLVFAYTDKEQRHRGISAFIVDRRQAGSGFKSYTLHNKAGIRAGNTGGFAMHDVRVPRANLLGEEGEGFKIAMSCLDNGRLTVGAGATGLIRACLDASVKYANERHTFGQPIGRHQLVQQMIARMVSNYDAARLLNLRAAWMKNSGMRCTRETALGKWFATDASFEAAADAVQIHGAYGYSDEYPVARFLRNAKGAQIYEGTSQVQTLMQA